MMSLRPAVNPVSRQGGFASQRKNPANARFGGALITYARGKRSSALHGLLVLALSPLVVLSAVAAAPMPVKHKQGSLHGFLLLKSADGKVIALGDLLNEAHGNEVRSRLTFRFRDGSIDDETTVFRQGSVFQLVTDHHIQKGPSFPEPVDILVDAGSGQVTTRKLKDGKPEVQTEQMQLPPDLANGLVPALLESFPTNAAEMKVSYVASTPKARLVTLAVKPDGKDGFQVGGMRREALRFDIHIELGGLAGVVAPVIGKEPSDTEVWVTDGEVPSFLKLQGPLYQKGPIWTMEVTSPAWLSAGE